MVTMATTESVVTMTTSVEYIVVAHILTQLETITIVFTSGHGFTTNRLLSDMV